MLKTLRLILALALAVALPAAAQQRQTQGTLIPSAAYTATVTSNDMDAANYVGVHVIINISSYTSGTFTCTIQGKDPVSGNYYTILASSALNSAATTVLRVYPGIAASANAAASDFIPKTWRITCVGATTPIATLSVGYIAAY
jgi:hypothetical protein